jgi:CHASE2 domain-containing sensor protein
MNKTIRTNIQFLLVLTTLNVWGQSDKRTEEIILINSSGQKCEVGQVINDLEKCNPTIIGLNELLTKDEDNSCDKLLLESIEKSGKIILVEGLKNKLSDESFYVKALYTGETGLASQNGDTTDFYYRIAKYQSRYSFPFLVALHYDKSKQVQLAAKSYPKYYPLKKVKEYTNFTTLNPSDISKNCKTIQGKIILVGNLSPNSTDTHVTNIGDTQSKKIYGTILQANVILEILKDLDTPDVKVNPYSDMIRQKNLEKN